MTSPVLAPAHQSSGASTAVLAASLVLLAVAYAWRWRALRRIDPDTISVARLSAFLAGVLTLWVAVGSPLAHLDQWQLTAHMIQHLLIMTVAAPLLLLGEPARVFFNGAPEQLRRWRPGMARLSGMRFRSPHPVLCWLSGTLIVLVWHVPSLFEVGMHWHALQHASFLVAGLLFWVPVVQPWPTITAWPRWSIPPYLFLATLPCDALSAFLAFCGRVMYPRYCSFESHAAISALDDQIRAGALMWFWVTFAYLVPAAIVTIEILSPSGETPGAGRART
jgi:putative membrane protein